MMYKIFVSALAFDEGKSGISNYIENSVYELAQENRVYVAILKKDIPLYTRKHKNIHFIGFSNILGKTILNLFFHFFILPFLISSKYDFIFLPAANRRLMLFYPLYTIVTFHDLSQFYIPQKYDFLRMFYIRHVIPLFLKRVDKIIAVSQNTKMDLLKYLQLSEEDIIVNHNGYDKNLYTQTNINEDGNLKMDLNDSYILYISRIEHPSKNHLRLIKAYELLPQSIKQRHSLVLVGSDCENAQRVHEYVNNSKYKEYITFLGFIPNEHMPNIIAHAKIFVFPSLYEGFGIPLVEAMAMKIPSLCASNSSLLEIGKDVCAFFDEYDEVNIKETILQVLGNEPLQNIMIKDGVIAAKKYDWRNHANVILEIYECKKNL